ncbi:alkaline phosphatase D family protein [Altericroceibacterium spongiae]|nr:alkaline phosphatase D family protein [Altericroceibacterium spongiae]
MSNITRSEEETPMSTVSRRHFFGLSAGGILGSTLLPYAASAQGSDYPFKLGVASGDPLPDSVVLWTRIAPDIFRPLPWPVEVQWEIAEDPDFQRISGHGRAVATPEWGHSVHAEPQGLAPGKDYYYRFHALGATSATGRTRTAPAYGAALDRMRFAVCACQNYTRGHYAAYRDMAEQRPDLIIHVGDYIYEHAGSDGVRKMPVPEAVSLADYRAYYAMTKTDPHLQAAHQAAPWMMIWDDHETINDYAGDTSPTMHGPAMHRRRIAAYRAYYENMPLRRDARPLEATGNMTLYRRAVFGDLVQFDLLDTRQYRSPHPCPYEENYEAWASCPADDVARTMLGGRQEDWLARGYGMANARWNMIVQTTQMTPYFWEQEGQQTYRADRWDGYVAARERLYDLIRNRAPANPFLIGGDVHAFMGSAVQNLAGEPVASELVCGAISSSGGGQDRYDRETGYYNGLNKRYFFDNRQNGYALCDVSPSHIATQLRAVENYTDPASPVTTLKALTYENGALGFA